MSLSPNQPQNRADPSSKDDNIDRNLDLSLSLRRGFRALLLSRFVMALISNECVQSRISEGLAKSTALLSLSSDRQRCGGKKRYTERVDLIDLEYPFARDAFISFFVWITSDMHWHTETYGRRSIGPVLISHAIRVPVSSKKEEKGRNDKERESFHHHNERRHLHTYKRPTCSNRYRPVYRIGFD